MTEPNFSDLTENLWSRLPEVYREEDRKLLFPMKRFISGPGDVAGAVRSLIERIEYIGYWERDAPVGDTSDLIDAMTADDAWLDWIAMIRGIDIASVKAEGLTRPLLISAAYNGGSKRAIKELVQAYLFDTKFCEVFDHTDNVSDRGDATEWDILVVTKEDELARGYIDDPEDPDILIVYSDVDPSDPDIALVPDNPSPTDPDVVMIENSTSDVRTIIESAKAKPVGTVIWHRNVETWTTPTYETWKTA